MGIIMAQERPLSLQDTFLRHVRDQSVPVTVFLVNGVKLQGYVTHIDRFGVALTRDHQTQFVYKHAISAINPLTAIDLSSGAA
jgi:host factor-I protein